MIDLLPSVDIEIKVDNSNQKLTFGQNVKFDKVEMTTLSDIVPILLNKSLKYPENVYITHKGVTLANSSYNSKLTYDVMHIPYGLLGIEFIKTHIYFSERNEGKFDSIVELISGEISILMQKNEEKMDDFQMETYVEELYVIHLKRGEKFGIPTGYYYTFVNTGLNSAVLSIVSRKETRKIDYSALSKERGLACYVISKNAKIETVVNPKYKLKCKPQVGEWKELKDNFPENIENKVISAKDSLFDIIHHNCKLLENCIDLNV